MEFYNKILCVTFEELTGGDEPVIKGDTLIKKCQSWQHPMRPTSKRRRKLCPVCVCLPSQEVQNEIRGEIWRPQGRVGATRVEGLHAGG